MAVKNLGLPPRSFAATALSVVRVRPSSLIRVSSFAGREPYFGNSGANRFDSPGCLAGAAQYASCYLGLPLPVAFAESILHDAVPEDGKCRIATSELTKANVHRFRGNLLHLADLTGAPLKQLGAHADLAGSSDYAITQAWALAVFNNHANVDGFIYMSRHLNTGKAVVLFDRAKHRLRPLTPTKLVDEARFADLMKMFNIVAL